jgi:hypothetical protein
LGIFEYGANIPLKYEINCTLSAIFLLQGHLCTEMGHRKIFCRRAGEGIGPK